MNYEGQDNTEKESETSSQELDYMCTEELEDVSSQCEAGLQQIDLYKDIIKEDPGRSHGYIKVGKLLLQDPKDSEKVFEVFSEAIQRVYYKDEVITEFAKMFTASKHFSKVIKVYQQAIQYDPQNKRPYLELGQIRRERKEYGLARDVYMEGLENACYKEDILEQLIEMLHDLGETDQLIQFYTQEIEKDPEDDKFYIRLGGLLRNQARIGEALKVYRAGIRHARSKNEIVDQYTELLSELGEHEKIISVYSKLIEWTPAQCRGYIRLGSFLRDQGNYDGVIELFTRAMGQVESKDQLIEQFVDIFSVIEEYTQVEQLYVEAIKHDIKNERLYLALGRVLRDQGKYESAEEVYSKGLEQAENKQDIIAQFVELLITLGKKDKLILMYSEALKHDPENHKMYLELAKLLIRQGQHEKAIKLYNRAVTIDPYFYEAYANSVQILIDQKDYERAIVVCKTFYEKFPGKDEPKILFAKVLSFQEKYEDAISIYSEVIKRNPFSFQAYLGLAQALHRQLKLDKAGENYMKAITYGSHDEEAYHGLGQVFCVQGQYDRSEEIYKKLTEDDPLCALGHFHLCIALYKQRKYEAVEELISNTNIFKDYSLLKKDLVNYFNEEIRQASVELKLLNGEHVECVSDRIAWLHRFIDKLSVKLFAIQRSLH